MARNALALTVLLCLLAPAFGATQTWYYTDHFGGSWHDATKVSNSNYSSGESDDLLCWAAAASNALQHTGWGNVDANNDTLPDFNSSQEIFTHFVENWTDVGGLPMFGWEYWFSGVNPQQGVSGWSQIEAGSLGQGGYFPDESMSDYLLRRGYADGSADSFVDDATDAMHDVWNFLHAGAVTTIGMYKPGGHAITVWGVEFDDAFDRLIQPGEFYQAIWVTDSDSYPDELRRYDLDLVNNQQTGTTWWRVRNTWDILGEVEGLLPRPVSADIPEPLTVLGVLAAVGVVARRARRA